MVTASEQLDRRFDELRHLATTVRPARGWIRAIRDALGMTTAQLARRMNVQQPRIVELEKAESKGNITMQSLERAAEALGCRVVYALVPIKPLTTTLEERALQVAERQLSLIEQTMRLEAQGVDDPVQRTRTRQRLADDLLRHPARLWDDDR
ncbi:MAG: putative DNA-binding mobile mystery protein A [Afipia broomeae]|jgi:predicted DNA-binding mobile mystery protein A|nr:MAG: mobile mystery protein A [Bradyrhizobiaceae bacterium]